MDSGGYSGLLIQETDGENVGFQYLLYHDAFNYGTVLSGKNIHRQSRKRSSEKAPVSAPASVSVSAPVAITKGRFGKIKYLKNHLHK